MADSFLDAARRHRSDARHLATDRRHQNGGHLIGFAAECLAKDILTNAGILIDKKSSFREHFPTLGEQIRTNARTRGMVALIPIIRSAAFLAGWSASSRYEVGLPPAEAEARYVSWSADVNALFSAAGLP